MTTQGRPATQSEPRTVALSLIRTTALYDAARRVAPGQQTANWDMHHGLTATLESWQAAGTLHEDSLLLTEWLAVDLCAYLFEQLGNHHRMERWLRDFGDQVCRAQKHAHPAGPTAIEILSVVTEDMGRRQNSAGAERLTRIGAPYLLYLRASHAVEDARQIALTLALWAGSQLAGLMRNDTERINAYMDARDHTPRP